MSLRPFLDLGPMPIANGFLDAAEIADEPRFPLRAGFDPDTKLVQLLDLVPPERMFHDQYAFYSSSSSAMAKHFAAFAESVKSRTPSGGLVVEIGCNDGIMLQHFAGRRHLGIEPSANVAYAARERGLTVVGGFFTEERAGDLVKEHGQADAVIASNVVCHVPDPADFFRGVAVLLKPPGLFIFEEPYLGDILRLCSFDQIYDEHASYFSLTSVAALANAAGLELVHAEWQVTHGGSMRYTVACRGERAASDDVFRLLGKEVVLGLGDEAAYAAFQERVDAKCATLRGLLETLKSDGKRVAAYGATSKSTTVTNYAGIGPELIEYITDTTPGKQGKLSPGVHIPVVSPERFYADPPDYMLLFAWNHAAEILAKETAYRERGGRFITHVPEVKIL
jgi:methylation protein EvaC